MPQRFLHLRGCADGTVTVRTFLPAPKQTERSPHHLPAPASPPPSIPTYDATINPSRENFAALNAERSALQNLDGDRAGTPHLAGGPRDRVGVGELEVGVALHPLL